MRDGLLSVAPGLLFGIGLIVSMMVSPAKVLAFLDISGDWDPSLILVMASAVLVTGIGYRLVFRRGQPLLADHFHLPQASAVDRRLLVGAAIFGIGWGMAGLCPGPALTALGAGRLDMLLFIPAMIIGLIAARALRQG